MNIGVYKSVRSIGDERIGRFIKRIRIKIRDEVLIDELSMPREIKLHEYFNNFVRRYRYVDINSTADLYRYIKADENHMKFSSDRANERNASLLERNRQTRLGNLRFNYDYENAVRFREIFEREFGNDLEIVS